MPKKEGKPLIKSKTNEKRQRRKAKGRNKNNVSGQLKGILKLEEAVQIFLLACFTRSKIFAVNNSQNNLMLATPPPPLFYLRLTC